jgi:CheY-like chemotaxis protein
MINNPDRNLPPRIMVVDDERDILRIIKRDLESPVSPVPVAKHTEEENELEQKVADEGRGRRRRRLGGEELERDVDDDAHNYEDQDSIDVVEEKESKKDSSSSITSTSSSDVRTRGIGDKERFQEMKEHQDQLREQNTIAAVGDTFMVETFTNGWNALEALESHPRNYYDLVLTDIRMPKMNGFELYRKIREKNPSMKIVFITAFEINKEEFNKVLPSIDVKDFIIKPISMTNLRARLKEVLEGR